MKIKTKERKEILLFLVICLPITWLLGWIAYDGLFVEEPVRWAQGVQAIACLVPAVVAILLCLLRKEGLWNLQFMPKLQNNGLAYLVAIVVGTIAVCLAQVTTPVLFPRIAITHPQATPLLVSVTLLSGISSACVQFIVSMGEELGWMGYLYPRMEKLFGMTGAIALSIVIRTSWHLVMTPWDAYLGWNMFIRLISHILIVCVGVWLTKKSGSVVPVAVFHSIVNTLTVALSGFVVKDNTAYEAKRFVVDLVQVAPFVLIGIVFFVILNRNKKSA